MTNDGVLASLRRWVRLRGRSALVVTGALDGDAARAFADRVAAGGVLPIPVDADGPARADVLVVIGRVSRKLAPVLVAARRRLAPGAVVLAFDTDDAPHPAAARADDVIDVDVLVRGVPPDDAMLQRALAALDEAFMTARERLPAPGDAHDVEPA
jgi:hypothetical protein